MSFLWIASAIVSLSCLIWGGEARARTPAAGPTGAETHVNAGNNLLRQGLFDEAISEFEQAGPIPEAVCGLGNTYRAQQQWQRAMDEYTRCEALAAERPSMRVYAQERRHAIEQRVDHLRSAPPTPPPLGESPAPARVSLQDARPIDVPAPTRTRRWYRNRWGVSLSVFSVATLVTGGALMGAAVAEHERQAKDLPGWDNHHTAAIAYGAAGWSCLAVGAGTGIAASIVFALGRRGEHR